MRKIIPLLLITCIWFIGCSDDDSGGNLIGTWVGTSIVVTDCQDNNRNGVDPLSCDDVSCYRLELAANDSFTYQRGLAIESGTWEVNDFLFLCTDQEGERSCERFEVQFSGISMILVADSTSSGCVSSYIFDPEVPADTTSSS